MEATIVITTKNRKEELRRALASCVDQTVPCEVLVVDDGSSDGTIQMVRSEFQKVRLFAHSVSRGYIVRRNEAASLAEAPVIVSIDDDAEFSSPRVVENALKAFVDDKVGAVAIPYIEPHKENRILQAAPDSRSLWITDRFIGTAHALRRDLFLQLGGYREAYFHQGEEADYSLRLMDAGYFVALGGEDEIIHHESPKRDLNRMDYYARRNDVLFAWQNVPLPDFLWRLPTVILGGIAFGLKVHRLPVMMRGLFAGLMALPGVSRQPVSRESFAIQRQMRKSGPKLLVCS